MQKLILWFLERSEATLRFAIETFKSKPNWSFVEGVRITYRERRPIGEVTKTELENRIFEEKVSTIVIPAVRYSSLEELGQLVIGSTYGTSDVIGAFADTLGNLDKTFLKFVNRRAREGQNLYFNVHIREDLVKEDILELA